MSQLQLIPSVDYVEPTGSGAGLTGITAAQVGAAATSHTQAISTVTGLQDALDTVDGRLDDLEAAPGGGAVASVNGQTGVVVLDADDVGAAAASHTQALTTITGTGMLPGLSRRVTYQPSGSVLVLIGPKGGAGSVTYASGNSVGHFRPMIWDSDRTIDFSQICVRVAGSLAGTARVAIYELASTNGPGLLVGQSDSATVPTVAGPIDLAWTTPCDVEAGKLYLIGFKAEHAGTNPTWACMAIDTSLDMGASFLVAASNTCNSVTGLFKTSMAAGAFPSDMTATAMSAHYNTALPWVGFELS
jgi:hypothetical protein